MIATRPARPGDAEIWCRLRHALWPEGSLEEHAQEIEDFFAGRASEPLAVLMAEGPHHEIIGFAELHFPSASPILLSKNAIPPCLSFGRLEMGRGQIAQDYSALPWRLPAQQRPALLQNWSAQAVRSV